MSGESYKPKTIWKQYGAYGGIAKLFWQCECGMEHPLQGKGKYKLECPCGQIAGFEIGEKL